MTDEQRLTEKALHPVSEYIMQPDIGLVIAKGLSVAYKEKPQNPVDFFAKWLLLQAEIKKKEAAENDEKKRVQMMKDKKEFQDSVLRKQKEEQDKEDAEIQASKDAFFKRVEESEDLNDNLQDLVDHIAENSKATAVYVGKITKPIKGIKDGLADDDDDAAHVIRGAKQHIEFIHASKDHGFLKEKILNQDEGVTYRLFKDDENNAKNPNIIDEKDGVPKHIFIKDVVREKDMFYYQVPRLGSYLAIKLEYKSCLFETSYDAAVDNYKEVDQLNKDQEDERRAYEEEQAEIKKAKEDEDQEWAPDNKTWKPYEYAPFKTQNVQFVVCLNTMGQDHEFSEESKAYALKCIMHFRDSWEKIEMKNLKKDVLQKTAQLEHDRNYKDYWETQDGAELEKRIQDAINSASNDKNAEGDEITEEEKDDIRRIERWKQANVTFYGPEELVLWKQVQEQMAAGSVGPSAAGGAPMSSEQDKRQPSQLSSSIKQSQQDSRSKQEEAEVDLGPPYDPLVPEQWQSKCVELSELHVIKFRRIFQTLFYMLKYKSREAISIKQTNCLEWKKAKPFFKINIENVDTDNLYKRMTQYNPFGPKEDEYREYQKIAFLRHNIDDINEEAVDEYSVTVGRIFRWLQLAIELRIDDVKLRRQKKSHLRSEREEAIERENERVEKRDADVQEKVDAAQQAHEEAEAKAEENSQEEPVEQEGSQEGTFDSEAFRAAEVEKFDEEYPPIEIPEEIVDDIDNDFNIEIEEEEASQQE